MESEGKWLDLVKTNWAELKAKKPGDPSLGLATFKLKIVTPDGPVRVALGPNSEPRMLLPLGLSSKFPKAKGGAGLSVEDSTFSTEKGPFRFIDITCLDEKLEKVFPKVSADIIRRISEGLPSQIAFENSLAEFRELLASFSGRSISNEKAIGLAGELLILKRVLQESPKGWRSWYGSEANHHDFRSGECALEVKTTTRVENSHIKISSLEQLEVPKNGRLFLAYVALEKNASGEIHIPTLAKWVLAKADDSNGLTEKLRECQFHPENPDPWDEFRFSLGDIILYEVKEGFPRIVPSMLKEANIPLGVSHVTYEVDLVMAKEFQESEDKMKNVIRRLGQCPA